MREATPLLRPPSIENVPGVFVPALSMMAAACASGLRSPGGMPVDAVVPFCHSRKTDTSWDGRGKDRSCCLSRSTAVETDQPVEGLGNRHRSPCLAVVGTCLSTTLATERGRLTGSALFRSRLRDNNFDRGHFENLAPWPVVRLARLLVVVVEGNATGHCRNSFVQAASSFSSLPSPLLDSALVYSSGRGINHHSHKHQCSRQARFISP
jgi:hypothetical protein